jgi:dihydrodipicolinate synthase/N-acetylneuraminate lyase
MKLSKKISGVIVPMVTPFTASGRIDEQMAERLINYLIEGGTSPFILGTTGESASISYPQRLLLVKTVVKVTSGRTKTFAGISSNSLETSIAAAKNYFDEGIDVVVAHPPCYYPIDADQMLHYFEKLADNLPGPLILYNITSVTHCSIPLTVVDKLSHHKKILGIKDSERDEKRLDESLKMWSDRDDFVHLVGWGVKIAYGLLNGSKGIVPSTGNIVPQLYRELYDAVHNGDRDQVKKLQVILDNISRFYQKDRNLGQSLVALKVILNELGLCQKNVLPPLLKLSKQDEKKIVDRFYELRAFSDTKIFQKLD